MNIKVEQITASYGKTPILEDLSIFIPEKKITTIVGPNGCGKSTLLKSIGRILSIQKGMIFLDGQNIHDMPTNILAQQMAILPQSPSTPEGITVEELVSYGRFPHQKAWGKLKHEDYRQIDWALKATELEDIRHKEVDNLSGGQRQRAWIGMALAQQSSIILLDEPTTYLDMSYQLEILELLQILNETEKTTIVMVLHDLNLAARFSDYLIGMKSGQILCQGTPHQVVTTDYLRKIFQVEAQIIEDPQSNKPVVLSYYRVKSGNEKLISYR
ncbi:ABC transporter ATP-binding protein [Spirochaeta cellobiosiphila]|uniref:ABC transporter ATP-binding protein n=1 Tax=Spirochaeta cellobiosiphila TaxID=504483 RepID=UPI00041B6EB1|nr:ABC transporter ATP-binding protein [Spirochaeta cellobiosiphila]